MHIDDLVVRILLRCLFDDERLSSDGRASLDEQ
jgi:hypothetical protein